MKKEILWFSPKDINMEANTETEYIKIEKAIVRISISQLVDSK